MRVRDIMTKAVVTISPDTSVEDAARTMRLTDVGLLTIGNKKEIVGVITDRDIALRVTADGKDARHTPVGDVMTKQPLYCFDDTEIEGACFMMEDNHVRRLLVFNRQRDVAGILSLDDVASRGRKERLAGHALSKMAKTA